MLKKTFFLYTPKDFVQTQICMTTTFTNFLNSPCTDREESKYLVFEALDGRLYIHNTVDRRDVPGILYQQQQQQ